MRKFYLIFLLWAFALAGSTQTVSIGNGTNGSLSTSTSSPQSPWNTYYGYSYVQTLYLQSEISASGNITQIRYYFTGSSLTNNQAIKVYMGTVTRSSFTSSTDWEPLSNLTLVYDGTVGTPTVPGWVTITLTTPFAYNNTGNLLIAVDENTPNDNGSSGFRTTALGTDRVIFYRSDTQNPDPASPQSATGRNNLVGNIQIEGLSLQGCQPPGNLAATYSSGSANLSWTAPAGGSAVSSYAWEVRTSGAAGSGATGLVASGTSNTTTATANGLSPNNVYNLYVRTACSGGVFSTWSGPVSFTSYPNDECTGAIVLTPSSNSTCAGVVSGNTLGATASSGVPGSCFGTADDDVWFKFVANSATQNITISNVFGSTDMYHQLLSGDCSSLTSVVCRDPNTTTATGLTVGATYYIRVYTYSSAVSASFDICVTSPPNNDDCSTATTLTVNPDLACGSVTQGNTLGATASTGIPGSCSGTADDDVWFKFVATATTHYITISNVSGSTDMYHQVVSGACGTQASIICSDPNSSTATGLVAGETYYVRVYTYSSSANASFDICVGTLPPPPANNDCSNATALTVSANPTCTTAVNATTAGATASTGIAGSCSGTADDDVWFKFVATNTSHIVTLSNVSGSTDMYHQVVSGACGTQTSLVCSDPNSSIASNLVVGETYYVRVYTFGSGNFASFEICITTPPPPPTNDECANATALTVVGTPSCTTSFSSGTTGATGSASVPGSCSGTADDDVWFKFVATSTSHIITLSNISGSTDMYHQVLGGACGSLTSVVCSDPNSSVANNLVAGETYYVRVYTYSSGNYATFDICVSTPPPPPPPPANDNCDGSIQLSDPQPINGTVFGATSNMAPVLCGNFAVSNPGGDVWYKFTTDATGGSATVTVANVTGDFDPMVVVYSGTPSANCTGLTYMTCADASGAGSGETLTASGLAANTTYYVRVYAYNAANLGTFTIRVSGAVVLPVTLVNFTGERKGGVNVLSWSTASEQNSKGFEVQRSLDRATFSTTAFVSSKAVNGTSSVSNSYHFTDARATTGNNYYRLKQIDLDGKFTYSPVVLLKGEKVSSITLSSVYPNPAKNELNVVIVAPSASNVSLLVTDITGKVIQQQAVQLKAGDNQLQLNVAKLTSGTYLLKALCADGCETTVQKFLKQ